ncbi:MAG: hemolysin family protein [Gemmatimonadales bacterium]
MIGILHLLVAPLATAVFALWAGWLAFAAEAEADLPRVLAEQLPPEAGRLAASRGLHVAHLALLVLAAAAAGTALSWWAWSPLGAAWRFVLLVGLVWIVGDLLPRLLATIAPDLPALSQPPAIRTLKIFAPLLRGVAWADKKGRPPYPAQRPESGPVRRDMLLGLFSLADTTVAEVMTPRIDIVAVDLSATRDEVINTLRSSEHARILVYDGQPDAVAGVLFAKDMLAGMAQDEAAAPWTALIRPAAFVPEAKTLDRQLRDFQRGPSHLAVVVDEFGGTAGIVTLEDILEQIVGEIQDEYDIDEVAPIQSGEDQELQVDGGVSLSELESVLGHSFGREDVSTVGGLMLAEFGRVPRSGEAIDLDGYRLVVDQVARRRVRRVSVRRPTVGAPALPPSEETS